MSTVGGADGRIDGVIGRGAIGQGAIGRGRGRLLAAGWLSAIGAIVMFAILGSGTAFDPAGPESRAEAGAAVAAPTVEYRLSVTAPSARNEVIRTRTIDVTGIVLGGGRVVVTLESRGTQLLATRSVITGADGRFRASFPLPKPRPGGRMWISAVLVADDGLPIEAIRRPIFSGPLDESL